MDKHEHCFQKANEIIFPQCKMTRLENAVLFTHNPLLIHKRTTPSAQLQKDHIYEELKPLWLELRVLGVLPVEKTTNEYGLPTFRCSSFALLYSITFFVVIGIFISYAVYMKILELNVIGSEHFDQAVHIYMHIIYLIPHYTIPLGHWKHGKEIARLLNNWTTFQVQFNQTKFDGKCRKSRFNSVFITSVAVPLLESSLMIIYWIVLPEFTFQDIFYYTYTNALVHLHIVLWFLMCCKVAKFANHLASILNKDILSRKIIEDCHSLWQELSCICRQIGDSFCYVYGMIIVLWFIVATLSLYGSLTSIIDKGGSWREIGLLINGAGCMVLLFIICDAGYRLSNEMSSTFYSNLQALHLKGNKKIEQEVNCFKYDVVLKSPIVSLGGYVTVNRSLLISLITTMVSQMVILLQFRIGIEVPNNSTFTCNETCLCSHVT